MRICVAVCGLALLVISCGVAPHADTSPPSPPTGQLAAWNDFPAAADPRPIVWFRMEDRGLGFKPDGDYKMAAVCGRYALAPGVQLPAAPHTAVAASKTGRKTSYGAISAASAFAALGHPPGGDANSQCTSVKPLIVTAVRVGDGVMDTDRGALSVTAYLFTAVGALADISYPALDPSAYWRGGATLNRGSGGVVGGRISADGLHLTVNFIGAATSGDCGADYVASAAESRSAVAVAIKAIALSTQSVICSSKGYARSVSVTLAAPLAGRVFVDEQGNVQPVCPETGDC